MIKEPYTYKNGCTLEMLDYGEEGVLIRMTDPDADVVSAVLLPPEVLNDAVDWFKKALKSNAQGQEKVHLQTRRLDHYQGDGNGISQNREAK